MAPKALILSMSRAGLACVVLAIPLGICAQVAGAPQAVGGNSSVERVGGFRSLDAAPAAPAGHQQADAAPARAAPRLPTARPQAPAAQPGQPVAPQQYPSAGSMPSPEINLVNEAIEQSAPLTPQQLRELRQKLTQRQEALSENVTGRPPAKATTQIYNIDLSPGLNPGMSPPVVRVEVNQGAIVSFLDAAGKPWPARVADNYSPKALTVSQFTEHQLSIATGSAAPINVSIAVALEGLPTAVTFNVISGQREVDSQVVMVIPKYRDGVPSNVGEINGTAALNSHDLVNFLLRTPPKTARQLTVEGVPGVTAWQISGTRMVLRSASKVLSGYFRNYQGVGDGTEVYEVPLSPQISFISGDQVVYARISGFTVGGFGDEK